ncbi:MAG: hypothetical protein AAF411_20325, partial [Myxococcota bacterium]
IRGGSFKLRGAAFGFLTLFAIGMVFVAVSSPRDAWALGEAIGRLSVLGAIVGACVGAIVARVIKVPGES